MKRILLPILIFVLQPALAQQGGQVFNDTLVHQIYIETDLPDWFATLEDDFNKSFKDPVTYPEVYRPCSVTFDGTLVTQSGFREKGNASNIMTTYGRKKPLKLSFNEVNDNQTLDGLKKMNLNNFINDPSCMRDAVCMKLMRDAGLYASRTSFAKVWVNGEYIGLYIIIENVDKTFLKWAYGGAANDGNLYKTDRGAKVWLDWKGEDKQAYKDAGMKLNTNDSIDDWSGFIEFVNFLSFYKEEDFKDKLEQKFDVHSYLKALAVEKLTRSWDSYWGGGNNYFMYHHPDGKFRWIPWDMNETFQDIKVLRGTSFLNGYLVPTPQMDERPLIRRIFEFPEYKQEYLDNVCSYIQTIFTLDHLGPFILRNHKLIERPYIEDTYKTNAYDAFATSLTETYQDDVSITKSGYVLRVNYPGLFPFIQEQREWAEDQLIQWQQNCSIKRANVYALKVFPNPASGNIYVSNENAMFEYANFKLLDFTGREAMNTPFAVMQGSEFKLHLKDVPRGIYILLKQSADGSVGKAKVIVEGE